MSFLSFNDRWDSRPYLQRLGDATSQWLNVALLNGMPDESISGRSYRNTVLRQNAGLPVKYRWLFVRVMAEVLFYLLDFGHHTEMAYMEDVLRAKARWNASKDAPLPSVNP